MELIKRTQSSWAVAAQVSQQRDESMDMIVPDVNPDVFAVLSVTARCTLEETVLRQGGAELSGSAEVLVLYTSEEERVCTLRAVLPLHHTCETAACTENGLAQTKMDVVTASASVLNPRKLSLRVTVLEEMMLWKEQSIELTESVQGEADEEIQGLTAEETGVFLAAVTVKRMAFTENLHLHGDAAGGSILLRSEAQWQSEEVRVTANRLLVRGSATVKVVTVTEQGVYAGCSSYTLPFSQTVECPHAEPGDRADISLVTNELDCKLIPGEEGMQLSMTLGGTLAAQVWREQCVRAVCDLYSTRFLTSYETATIPLCCLPETTECREEYAEICECQPVTQICDWSWCVRSEIMPDGGTLCRYWFRILCRMEDGCLQTVCHRADVHFAQEDMCTLTAENVYLAPADGGISIRFSACATFRCSRVCGLRQVSACILDRKNIRPRPEPGTLLLRAVAAGETVWSISKQYGVKPEQLRSANKLVSESALMPGQLVIIPFAG